MEMCSACERGQHWDCGLQTWCKCECDPEAVKAFDPGDPYEDAVAPISPPDQGEIKRGYDGINSVLLGLVVLCAVGMTELIPSSCGIARAGVGAAALALSQGEQCKKNLQGETQYASMLHDERDQYEQQDAALVIQRDELKKQIQELGKQLADLQKQIGSSDAVNNGSHQQMSRTELIPSSPAATPSPAPSPAKSRTQPGWPNPSPK